MTKKINKELVFCTRCLFYKTSIYYVSYPECTHIKNLLIQITPLNRVHKYGDCNELNKKNNCKNFKKIMYEVEIKKSFL